VDPIDVLLAVTALVIGAAVGWVAASRQAAKRDEEFRRAIKELGDARIENATLKANAENFDKQLELMRQAREDLIAQFKAAGGEVLSKAQASGELVEEGVHRILRDDASSHGELEQHRRKWMPVLLRGSRIRRLLRFRSRPPRHAGAARMIVLTGAYSVDINLINGRSLRGAARPSRE
jgi:hypothetical protein